MLDFDRLNQRFEDAAPQEILRWGYKNFGQQMALVTSFQPTGIVTLHMLHEFAADVPVLTLDTHFLFPETYDLIEEIEEYFDIHVQRIQPDPRDLSDATLWQRDPDQCCFQRKVLPLQQALQPYHAWLTGLRRDQSAARASVPIVRYDPRHQNVKIAPFAHWTEDMLWTYIKAYELPCNALHDAGYPSIGCTHCTRPVAQGEAIRAGRWADQAKTECGIHLPLDREEK